MDSSIDESFEQRRDLSSLLFGLSLLIAGIIPIADCFDWYGSTLVDACSSLGPRAGPYTATSKSDSRSILLEAEPTCDAEAISRSPL
jgi:hypothetical protein